ncbi:hypothetical protein E4U43_004535 [Claviceps pusilla]|uniref:DNA (cytosine-5)-methyltransferase 1 replication foci domain-containing protein n=1 Tax=Claviceps pusilla TaxID=123648 RepID=A0A9P7N5N8_9HYPO|nr:hypothetical protein E4U43_004535 [Claviceps pusilla]
MTGRSRRASTSSVESECESDIRWRQESSVLRTISKDQTPDDWPIFELANAIVLDKDGQRMENALLVGKRGPFIVRGHLIIDDPSQKSHLIMRVRTSTPLEIRRSMLYSIGESEDGRPLIWVSGQGGWYEIDPCRAYKPMYNKMCEATTMYYTLLDIYTENPPKKHKKGKTPTIMEELGPIFLKYVARIGDGSTIEEVIARAREHAVFFINKLSQNDTSLDWSTTAFYKWIFSEFAEQHENTSTISTSDPLSQPQPQQPHPLNAENAQAGNDSSTTSINAADSHVPQGLRGERTKARSSTPKTIDKPAPSPRPPAQPPVPHASAAAAAAAHHSIIPLHEPSPGDDAPDSPLQLALSALTGIFDALASGRNGITLTTTLTRLYFSHSFPNFRDGRVGSYKRPVEEYIHYYSRALLPLLDEKYQQHEIYSQLQRLANTELKLVCYKPSDFPVIIYTRNSQPRKGPTGNAPSTPTETSNRHIPNDSTGESPRPMGKRPTRTPGKSSVQPISRAPKKRLRNEFETDHNPDSNSAAGHTKKSHYFDNGDLVDQDTDMDDIQPVDSADENDVDDVIDQSTQDRYGLEPIKLVIRAEKIPESSPRGPDDTWTCDQEGCDYIVRGSSEEDCRDRIQQHFRDHEQQLTRVNLAMTEGARGHMPINHLLDKIKQLRGDPSNPQIQPIKRKLIV